jgi:hypothetical protein
MPMAAAVVVALGALVTVEAAPAAVAEPMLK